MHGDGARGVDADLDLVATDVDNNNGDVIADHDSLASFATDDKHVFLPEE